MITSGVEFSPERLQEIFQTGKSIKVPLIWCYPVQEDVLANNCASYSDHFVLLDT